MSKNLIFNATPEQATFRDLLNQLHTGDCNKDDLNLLFCWQLIINFLAYRNSAHKFWTWATCQLIQHLILEILA